MKVGRLTITAGPPEGRELFPLADISVFEIGRAPGSHIRLSDESVSINHCRIFRRGEEYTLYALSEIKPTTLNGKDAKRAPIQHGDRIGIGAYELAFELLEPADAATPNPQLRRAAPNPPPGAPNDAAAAPPHGLSPARLVVLEGENRGTAFPLAERDKFTVGRAAGCDVRLPDAKVSREHCLIEQLEGQYIIIDLQSANGTIVNGERVRKTVLQNSDFLRLGFTLLKFEAAREA